MEGEPASRGGCLDLLHVSGYPRLAAKVPERWEQFDQSLMLQQLGLA